MSQEWACLSIPVALGHRRMGTMGHGALGQAQRRLQRPMGARGRSHTPQLEGREVHARVPQMGVGFAPALL